jgi:hypothetical protein
MGLGASRASAPSGAFTVVQDPSEALYAHMPQAAIAADGIDFQVPPADVGPTILAVVARRREAPSSRAQGSLETEEEVAQRPDESAWGRGGTGLAAGSR